MSEELPEGWAAATLGDLITGFEAGRNLRAEGHRAAPGEYGVLKISAVTWGSFRPDENKALLPGDAPRPHEKVRRGDLLITRANTSDLVGAVVLVDRDYPTLMLPDKILRLCVRDGVDPAFLLHALRTPEVREHFEHNATGTSDSMRNLAQPKIAAAPLRVAPMPEQRRIVTQVEALLEQVKRAKGRLDRVPLILMRFRQAVLAAACSGELTKEWRDGRPSWQDEATAFKSKLLVAPQRKEYVEPAEAEHDVPDGWPTVSLAAIATHLTSGSRAWSPYYQDDGFGTFVMAQNVRPMRFDRSYRQGVAPPPNDPERLRTTVQEGDILVTIVGANTGDVCRVDVPVRDYFVCQSVALARLSVPGFAPFVELWLNSPRHGQRLYQEWAYGEGRPHLSFDHLRSTPIAIPGQQEQAEILRRVNALFALSQTIERRLQTATARADKLPQAILSKAFSGELVPTEADLARAEGRTYETAEEQLARIANGNGNGAERVTATVTKRGKSSRGKDVGDRRKSAGRV